MLGFFKNIFDRRKIKKAINMYEKRKKRYLSLSNEEFALLPETELYDAALARVFDITDACEEMHEALAALNVERRVFYIAASYEMEVSNGGLCQFFVNSTRYLAPHLSFALEKIGAFEHKEIYDGFISENSIDVKELSSFDTDTAEKYEEQTHRYPFDDFDRDFYEKKPISDYLTSYIKNNPSSF